MLPKYKKEHSKYKTAQSQILQDVLRRLDRAYKNFFDKRAKYPKFKDKYHYTSITLPQCEAKRKKSEKKLKKAQRQLSRKKKGSNNREKQKKRLAKLHEKVANQRRDYLHKISYNIVKNNDIICIEDLQVKNMMKNHKLAKSIANAGWRMLDKYLQYKAEKERKIFVKVKPAYTSQRCSRCGKIVEKDLSVRVHKCECGLEIDRDVNAAINILREGLRHLGIAA